MEILFLFSCAGDECVVQHQAKIDGLSVITPKSISQIILERDAWPAGWAMTRDAKGNEKHFCPRCLAAGKAAAPTVTRLGKPPL